MEGGDGDLDLLPPEWEVLALIDGERDLRAIAATLGRSDFDLAKTLFGLESAGLIVLVDPGSTAQRGRGRPATAAALVAEAEMALDTSDLERARAAAERASAVQPHDPVVHQLLGRIHLAGGRTADAVDELRRALRLDPQAVAAQRLLGFALVQLGRFAEAVDHWDQWERLAAGDEQELAHRPEVAGARDAARLLAGTGTRAHA
jgi:tetratricopeptide (TPR) repeat protein